MICFLLFWTNSFALILFCKKTVQNCCLQACLEVLLPVLADEVWNGKENADKPEFISYRDGSFKSQKLHVLAG